MSEIDELRAEIECLREETKRLECEADQLSDFLDGYGGVRCPSEIEWLNFSCPHGIAWDDTTCHPHEAGCWRAAARHAVSERLMHLCKAHVRTVAPQGDCEDARATLLDSELDVLESLAGRATPGKWLRWMDVTISARRSDWRDEPHIAVVDHIRDADYIAAACPQVVLSLVHELRACRTKLAEYEQQGGLYIKSDEN